MTSTNNEADAVLGDASSPDRQHDAIFHFGIKAILDGAAGLIAKLA